MPAMLLIFAILRRYADAAAYFSYAAAKGRRATLFIADVDMPPLLRFLIAAAAPWLRSSPGCCYAAVAMLYGAQHCCRRAADVARRYMRHSMLLYYAIRVARYLRFFMLFHADTPPCC